MVEIPLEQKDVYPNRPELSGETPLWLAAKGHEGVVKTLLGRDDVDPYRPNRSGLTPLQTVPMNGHTGVVTLLQPPASATSRAS